MTTDSITKCAILLFASVVAFALAAVQVACQCRPEPGRESPDHRHLPIRGEVLDISAGNEGSVYVLANARPGSTIGPVAFNPGSMYPQSNASPEEKPQFLVEMDTEADLESLISLADITDNCQCSAYRFAVHDANTIYVAGHDSNDDIAVLKLDSDGQMQWSRNWGRESHDSIGDMCVDSDGKVYVVGQSDPVRHRSDGRLAYGNQDGFLVGFDAQGNMIQERVWGSYDTSEWTHGICADADNNVYVCGSFNDGFDLQCESQAGPRASEGRADCLVFKLDRTGNCEWATAWGGNSDDEAFDIGADDTNSLFVCGIFADSFTLETEEGETSVCSNGSYDAFLLRMSPDGEVQWIRAWGSPAWDSAAYLGMDQVSDIYIGGHAEEECEYDPGPNVVFGSKGIFVMRFSKEGDFRSIYTFDLDTLVTCLACSGVGNVYVGLGFTENGNFETERITAVSQQSAITDALVLKLVFE